MADQQPRRVMPGFGSSQPASGRGFWKRGGGKVPGSIRPVFGAQHPPLQEPLQLSKKDSPKLPTPKSPTTVSSKPQTPATGPTVNPFIRQKSTDSTDIVKPRSASSPTDISEVHHRRRSLSLDSIKTTGSPTSASEADLDGRPRGASMNSPSPACSRLPVLSDRDAHRLQRFVRIIEGPLTSLEELSKVSWSGIPHPVRPTVWQLLCGYLPVNFDRRAATLERKRGEYRGYIKQYYHTRLQPMHEDTFRQIHIDIPRQNPTALFQQEIAQHCFERLLYIWAMRHPASGYVQGMNDLATPFFVVFLGSRLDPMQDPEAVDLSSLDPEIVDEAESDTYWCLTKLMDGIQDNYTFAQPGIQKKVHKMKKLVERIDAPLYQHLDSNSIEFMQFSFRWMNNLLIREVPLSCIIRLFDTYLCERDGFASFHPYVCAAFLVHWSKQLLKLGDFQDLLVFLQNLPTEDWTEQEINEILAAAFQWKFTFNDAAHHLQ